MYEIHPPGLSGCLIGDWADDEALALLCRMAGVAEDALEWRRDPDHPGQLALVPPLLGLRLRAATIDGLKAAVEHLAYQAGRLLVPAQIHAAAADVPVEEMLAKALARLLAVPSPAAPPEARFIPVGGFSAASLPDPVGPDCFHDLAVEDHRTVFER